MIDIKVPAVGESISEVTLVKWLKNDGEYVERDEVIAELESEKATFEVNAEQAGILKTIGIEDETLKIGDVLAQIDETAPRPEGKAPAAEAPKEEKASAPTYAEPVATKPPVTIPPTGEVKATPVASAMIADKGVNPASI